MREADRIREFGLDKYIEPARSRGDRYVTIRTGDVGKAMGLLGKMPAVCSALKARKFERFANVELVEAKGPAQGSNLYLTFRLLGPGELPQQVPSEGMRPADRIRKYVLENCIEPARSRGESFITTRVGDVHDAMKLSNRHAAVAGALKARKFESYAKVQLVEKWGPQAGSNLRLRFKLLRSGESVAEGTTAAVDTAWPGTRPSTIKRMQQRVDKLIAHFDQYIQVFDEANPFTGASLYFHLRTIEALRKHRVASGALDDDCFFVLLYGTLASWGMQRPGLISLVDFRDMVGSFVAQRPAIERLENIRLSRLSDSQIRGVSDGVWKLMDSLSVGRQRAKLVVNSKALHHVLPDLVPPIDRAYVLRFFYNRGTLTSPEEKTFKEIYPFFHRVAQAAAPTFPNVLGKGMHTSETKIIDNAIVGFVLAELK